MAISSPMRGGETGTGSVQPGGSGAPAGARRGLVRSLVVSARPRQWVKNVFVLVPAGFGGGISVAELGRVGVAVVAFCLAASSLYLLNDVSDRDADRLHERKRRRPIATGELSAPVAVAAAVVGLAAALGLAAISSVLAAIIIGAYIVTTVGYSTVLKHVVVLDVLVIASGFVLRILGGAAAAHVTPSKWLLLCMTFLALFLGFGKRRHELVLLGSTADAHRPVLGEYTEEALDQFLVASMIGTLFAYVLYTFLSPAGADHQWLLATLPFAAYGILRYMLIIETRTTGGAPEELLLTDRPLQIAALGWVAVAAAALYLPLPHITW